MSWVCQGSVKRVSLGCQEHVKGVFKEMSRVCHRYVKDMSRAYLGGLTGMSWLCQGGVTWYHGHLMGMSWVCQGGVMGVSRQCQMV